MKKLIIAMAACMMIVGCKKQHMISCNVLSKSLAVKETYTVPATCEDPIIYTSANEYAVQVSSNGIVTARHYTGKGTEIALTSKDDSKSFIVHVAPRNTLYNEPKFAFGHPRSTFTPSYQLVATTDDANLYSFKVGGEDSFLMVAFSDDDCVSAYSVLVPIEKKRDLDVFLEDRYEYIGCSSGYDMYINALKEADVTMLVGVDLFNYNGLSLWMADYLPYAHDNKTSIEDMKGRLLTLLK